VLCTGGFQHADAIAAALRSGNCDAVSIGRRLIANNDLAHILKTSNGPEQSKACSYCNKCLVNNLENPLGCYEVTRYPGATFELPGCARLIRCPPKYADGCVLWATKTA
jgi:2,4-dienoyl-CoA reductase (NADPH2)